MDVPHTKPTESDTIVADQHNDIQRRASANARALRGANHQATSHFSSPSTKHGTTNLKHTESNKNTPGQGKASISSKEPVPIPPAEPKPKSPPNQAAASNPAAFKQRNLGMGGRALGAANAFISGSRDLDGDKKDSIKHTRSDDMAEFDQDYISKDVIGQ